jgi:Xaa-Pro aminopeptidase
VTRDVPDRVCFVSSTGEIDQVLDSTADIVEVINFGTFYRERHDAPTLPVHEERLFALSTSRPEPNGVAALIAGIKRMGLQGRRVGFDENGFRIGVEAGLRQALPQTTLVPASSVFAWVRRVKSAEEIELIRQSALITERAIVAATRIAHPGVTERELYLEFNRSVASQGGRPEFTMIKFGRNGVGGQVKPNGTALQRGDTIWFDVGCSFEGYWSDLARTYNLGEPSVRVQRLYRAMLAGEDEAIANTRPGMTGSDVFHLTVQAVRDSGEPAYRRHHVGHGIGAEVYEQPILADRNEVEIEPGMVINIETPYYAFGVGAVHIEDPFVVAQTGANAILTTLSREMLIL